MYFITGDTHGDFRRVEELCNRMETTVDDVLIILGDAGINYSPGNRDNMVKGFLSCMPITLFCIHGNHEQRPQSIHSYGEMLWNNGTVFREEKYPNQLFAKDGEIYELNGKKCIAIGGAYSIDKEMRLAYGYGWWEDEQPSEQIKAYVERQLEANDWSVDVVLSHTSPYKYEPREVFLKGIDQSNVDKSTEIWLDGIEDRLAYEKWYCGHYHTKKKIDKLEFMFENYDEVSW